MPGKQKIEVIIDGSEGSNINVEIIARAEHHKVFVGTEIGQDAYQCIDLAVHKLEGQLRKAKGKERDNKHPNDKVNDTGAEESAESI